MTGTTEVKLMGKIIGIRNGYDAVDFVDIHYEFEPADGVPIPACHVLNIDYELGLWEAFDDDFDTLIAKGTFDYTIKVDG